MKSEFPWDNLWMCLNYLSISMIMVPRHSVKRVGLSPLCKKGRPDPTPTELEKKRRVKLTVVKGEEQP